MFRKRHPPMGARPGTLVVDAEAPQPRVHVIDYTGTQVDETDVTDVQTLKHYVDSASVTWIDVQGLGDGSVIRGIADVFSFHPLLMEDIVNVPQRPKADLFTDQLLVVTRMPRVVDRGRVDREQISFCIGRKYVITFQEQYGDVFDPIRRQLRSEKSPLRAAGPDFLAHALMDLAVDAYYPVLEALGEHLESLESDALTHPSESTLQEIFRTKRELLELRRSIWPQREVFNALIRDESALISEPLRIYLRDTYDHCIQVIDVLETYREVAGGLLDVYMSSVSNRMNDVMKVLTVMASIFIPITFLAGIYGMNFDAMPELHIRWGYPILLLVMAGVAGGMLWFFRRRGWIWASGDSSSDAQLANEGSRAAMAGEF